MEGSFAIRFKSKDIRPESFSLGELVEFLKELNSIIKDFSDTKCSLVQITRPGAAFYVYPEDIEEGEKLVQDIADSLDVPQEDASQRQKRVRNYFAAMNHAKQCSVSIYNTKGKVIKQFGGKLEPEPKSFAIVNEAVTLQGKIVSAGGTRKPQVEMRLATGMRVTVYGNENFVREMGKRLYSNVIIHGQAAVDWNSGALTVTSVTEFEDFYPESIETIFEDLRNEFGGKLGLDDMDPVEFQRSLRD